MIKKNNFNSYNNPYISNSNFFSITLILISLFILVSTFNLFYGFIVLFLMLLIIFFSLNIPRLRRRKNWCKQFIDNMKNYKCVGCSNQNHLEKMKDKICPYCGELMEEINEKPQEIYEDFLENVPDDDMFSD